MIGLMFLLAIYVPYLFLNENTGFRSLKVSGNIKAGLEIRFGSCFVLDIWEVQHHEYRVCHFSFSRKYVPKRLYIAVKDDGTKILELR